MMLVHYYHPDFGAQLGLQRGDTIYDISDRFGFIGALLRSTLQNTQQMSDFFNALADKSDNRIPVSELQLTPDPESPHWLPPLDDQEVWAAGVTYLRSRVARQEEAVDGGDVYDRVYRAERPELFFKAQRRNVVGHGGNVGIRRDATWSVPEPELAVVFNPALEVVGFTIGNDMSSRDIEGANPLYLPQAKVYTASCALGPGILLNSTNEWPQAAIRIEIERGGVTAFEGETHTKNLNRSLRELADYLGRSNTFPYGVILMTGTGIVPPAEFTLAEGDVIRIHIEGIGTLTNTTIIV